MNVDRDLPAALRPLAGDPVADAARVLAALPAGPPPGGGPSARPWLPWTLLAVGLLAGVGIGRVVSGPAGNAQPMTPTNATGDKPDRDTKPDKTVKPDKPDKPDKSAPQPGPGMADYRDMLQVMAFGPIEVDEPGSGVQALDRGEWHTALGTLFRTGRGQAGIYAYANDARARLDRDTVARISPDLVQIEFGRAWVDTGDMTATVRVECGRVRLALESGAGGVFTKSPSGVRALALRGKVVLRTDTETLVLREHESVFVDADRGPEAVEKVPFVAPATAWMIPMIEMSSDPREMPARVQDVIAAYEQGEFRAAARREILKLGSRCVWLLADIVDRNASRDVEFAHATAELIAQLVDFRTARYVLPLLLQDDAELRVIVFRGVRAATSTDAGTDEQFWQRASKSERQPAIERWQEELSR
jgi:hypothetical protein